MHIASLFSFPLLLIYHLVSIRHVTSRPTPQMTSPSTSSIEEIKQVIAQSMPDCSDMARLSIRAAFHDGGAGRLPIEISRAENLGLQPAMDFYNSNCFVKNMSFADCVSLGAVMAVKVCGGPDVAWKPGRVDNMEAERQSALPGVAVVASDIVGLFSGRGMSSDEMVALIGGAHSVANVRNSPDIGTGATDSSPSVFDNKFFTELLQSPGKATIPGTVRIPADSNMLLDPQMLQAVQKFAADSNALMVAFKSAFEKMISTTAPMTPLGQTIGGPAQPAAAQAALGQVPQTGPVPPPQTFQAGTMADQATLAALAASGNNQNPNAINGGNDAATQAAIAAAAAAAAQQQPATAGQQSAVNQPASVDMTALGAAQQGMLGLPKLK